MPKFHEGRTNHQRVHEGDAEAQPPPPALEWHRSEKTGNLIGTAIRDEDGNRIAKARVGLASGKLAFQVRLPTGELLSRNCESEEAGMAEAEWVFSQAMANVGWK